MKKLLLPILTIVALLALGAASVSTSDSLVRIQTDPASGQVQAYFERAVTIDGVTYKQPWDCYSWELATATPVTITLTDGTTATTTRAAVFAAVRSIAQQEHDAQLAAAAAPTPTPTPTLTLTP